MLHIVHDNDKPCGGIVPDAEHVVLTTQARDNILIQTPPGANSDLCCVIKAGFQDVAEKRIPLPNTTNNFSSDFAYCELPY